MGQFEYDGGWLEVVCRQEEQIRLACFTRADALAVGLEIVRLAETRYHGAAAVSILEDGVEVFCFKMEGAGLENEWWMRRKLAATRLTGVSSMRAFLELEAGEREPLPQSDSFAACGGCVPVTVGAQARVCILVSGLRHFEDHQVIIDALAAHMGRKLETLVAP